MNDEVTIKMRYSPLPDTMRPLSADEWRAFGSHLAHHAARRLSTKNHRLSQSTDFDFDPLAYQDGYLGVPVVIVIEMIKHPERVEMLKESAISSLKDDFLEVFGEWGINQMMILKIKWDDPDNFAL